MAGWQCEGALGKATGAGGRFCAGIQVMEDGRPIAGPVGRLVKPGV
ncbi:protein of unknown function [Kyrpidia spormannii]|uniref:Uncharacterized protein n=2 Tax=Kyrpidia spormannii TaxID=2055160 RepID=A0ACA8Z6K7_9BACL|nr:protein of unknown function [Kyrpidia spormannii]CAB3390559.1 protein of unknown function [Kyrpidia spormannii]